MLLTFAAFVHFTLYGCMINIYGNITRDCIVIKGKVLYRYDSTELFPFFFKTACHCYDETVEAVSAKA